MAAAGGGGGASGLLASAGAVTADDVNLLVYRYLQESGFRHSAFTFGYEAAVHSASLGGADAPPGALVAFLQKGLQYLELEANLTEDGGDVDAGFSLLTAHDLLSRDVDELKALVAARRAQDAGAAARERAARERAAASLGLAPAPAGPAGVKDERGRDEAAAAVAEPMDADDGAAGAAGPGLGPGGGRDAQALAAAAAESWAPEFGASQVRALPGGHTAEVYAVGFSPAGAGGGFGGVLVASGGADGTARVWAVPAGGGGAAAPPALLAALPADGGFGGGGGGGGANGGGASRPAAVTCVAWRADGRALATGTDAGGVCVWGLSPAPSPAGGGGAALSLLRCSPLRHAGPVYCARWRPGPGGQLLTTGHDGRAVLDGGDGDGDGEDGGGGGGGGCDGNGGGPAAAAALGDAPGGCEWALRPPPGAPGCAAVCDADWRDGVVFGACCGDGAVLLVSAPPPPGAALGRPAQPLAQPVALLPGHDGAAHCVRWEPFRGGGGGGGGGAAAPPPLRLASCAKDGARVWWAPPAAASGAGGGGGCALLRGHGGDVLSLAWAPRGWAGGGGGGGGDDALLATCSADGCARLWRLPASPAGGASHQMGGGWPHDPSPPPLPLPCAAVLPHPGRCAVHGAAFSPCGSRLATAGAGALLRVWSVPAAVAGGGAGGGGAAAAAGAQPLQPLLRRWAGPPGGDCLDVAWGPCGDLAVACADASVRLIAWTEG